MRNFANSLSHLTIQSYIMGPNCSGCTRTTPDLVFSGRHRRRRISSVDVETDFRKVKGKGDADNHPAKSVSIACFRDGEILSGFGLMAEVNRSRDNKLTYIGWRAKIGNEEAQILWTHQYSNIAAVFFTVDGTHRQYIKTAKTDLHQFIAEERFRNFYLLVFFNNDRNPNSMDAKEIEQKLKLSSLKHCLDYRVQPSVGQRGCGFQCGLVWLYDLLEKRAHPGFHGDSNANNPPLTIPVQQE